MFTVCTPDFHACWRETQPMKMCHRLFSDRLTALGPQLSKRSSTPVGALLGTMKAFLASVSALMPQTGTQGTTLACCCKVTGLIASAAFQSPLFCSLSCVCTHTHIYT